MDLFGTAGIRGPTSELVTPELALAVGRAVAVYAETGGETRTSAGAGNESASTPDARPEVVVARDGRLTGPGLLSSLVGGLESGGVGVDVAGRLPTPALAHASRGRLGVMITASHNPPIDNGIKLFADGQEFPRHVEREIQALVEEQSQPALWSEWRGHERVDGLGAYRRAAVEFAFGHGDDLEGTCVAVDCGNGTAGLATPQVLTSLGADVRALNANVDGHFPARKSKPTTESLADLRAFVATSEARLGFGHDGDGDRLVVLDADGTVVHEDTVLAILAEHYTRRSTAGDPVVVTTPNASARVDERVREAGGRVERVRLGALHEGIETAREEGNDETEVVFAGEPWKHVHTAFGPWMDAIVSAAVISRLVADRGLAALREPITERPYRKVNVSCPDRRKDAVMARLETDLPAEFPDATVDTEYGVRLEFPNGGWALVRPSGTEPYVRIYVERSDVDELVEELRDAVSAAV